ncbi:hypothetical protein CEXT_482591 [Caerostris extrusa]|uniref:Uncharacterized protein n=1 Tax=Caerostris extrusa TaxID=172846 RepID=A0AAV4XGS7_CAEEX|nr:hypothetical protein CEXT_482591 [Caerostris extrusa]
MTRGLKKSIGGERVNSFTPKDAKEEKKERKEQCLRLPIALCEPIATTTKSSLTKIRRKTATGFDLPQARRKERRSPPKKPTKLAY